MYNSRLLGATNENQISFKGFPTQELKGSGVDDNVAFKVEPLYAMLVPDNDKGIASVHSSLGHCPQTWIGKKARIIRFLIEKLNLTLGIRYKFILC